MRKNQNNISVPQKALERFVIVHISNQSNKETLFTLLSDTQFVSQNKISYPISFILLPVNIAI